MRWRQQRNNAVKSSERNALTQNHIELVKNWNEVPRESNFCLCNKKGSISLQTMTPSAQVELDCKLKFEVYKRQSGCFRVAQMMFKIYNLQSWMFKTNFMSCDQREREREIQRGLMDSYQKLQSCYKTKVIFVWHLSPSEWSSEIKTAVLFLPSPGKGNHENLCN